MSHSIGDIAAAIGAEAVGNTALQVDGAAEPAEARSTDIAIAITAGFLASLDQGNARAALVPAGTDWQGLGLEAAIIAPRGRLAMSGLTRLLDPGPDLPDTCHDTAVIEAGALISDTVGVGAFSYIGAGARIGPGTRIGHHVSVAAGVEIGADCHIHDGVRIGRGCRIGAGSVLHPNVVIGADGFSFVTEAPARVEAARDALGQLDLPDEAPEQDWRKIHSLGGVEIGADVEIGAGSTIDAGTIRATRIGQGTKIDNLVQVGHNVIVGRNCLLCAQSGVAGSARIGDRTVLGGKAGVADNVTIGADVVLGGGSVALSNVPAGRIMLGYPAMRIESHIESYRALRRLPRILDRLRNEQKPVPKRAESD
ncbi:UDP-3-O-(3-hydroxymyristoyl)glucosamine N-acyltransferase [Ponticoccus sp. SC2-23]|uniref:UDP-3-O-(3-hydroxymyristoyl)glucosamine N-acyltransferase n=1 Tax=Alexandriicola marinus TaxID=2081710 RepID=UPI000FDAEF3E|nr:UDP-3-O-(3-hydroxymyristoyl)glucosamine N-acyltransferase [Alexandriicola marinus]MBM1218940.1 UDP-3-O-(3-hydroxymyristoyl)glucosamine N-acyltransferase [Ponticoccus sp. SC6-9]MBM1223988.1 UDP-3-O-(3-hydroxymyristoyl)glucosamine N-acyltransferase [Ponticoccus sp. SC6-15]MBM1230233.1 UDP-3-O-(3-hydroxymyristoyl)glucosamine N-acyltransferase [Ponticoccus sp. SC6-38]MBM1232954.1 UDP-3-O-(3-hydroxymyristoyl)glucosamine N-acyltransferase [Ponticoccus sp. SC6-45]MBM1237096.1 UDP-3-O-(3-hydroxymyr